VVNSPALAPRPGAPSPLLRAQVPDAPDLDAFLLSGPASGERPRNSNRDSEDEDEDEDREVAEPGLREELVRAHAGQNGTERGSSVEGQDGGGSDDSDSDDGSYSPGVSDLTGSVDSSADGSATSSEDGSYSPGESVTGLGGSGESVSESEGSDEAKEAEDGLRGAGSGDADMASPGLERSDEEIPSSEAGSLSGSEGGAAARGGARHSHAAAHGAGTGGTPLPTFNLPSLSAVIRQKGRFGVALWGHYSRLNRNFLRRAGRWGGAVTLGRAPNRSWMRTGGSPRRRRPRSRARPGRRRRRGT